MVSCKEGFVLCWCKLPKGGGADGCCKGCCRSRRTNGRIEGGGRCPSHRRVRITPCASAPGRGGCARWISFLALLFKDPPDSFVVVRTGQGLTKTALIRAAHLGRGRGSGGTGRGDLLCVDVVPIPFGWCQFPLGGVSSLDHKGNFTLVQIRHKGGQRVYNTQ